MKGRNGLIAGEETHSKVRYNWYITDIFCIKFCNSAELFQNLHVLLLDGIAHFVDVGNFATKQEFEPTLLYIKVCFALQKLFF